MAKHTVVISMPVEFEIPDSISPNETLENIREYFRGTAGNHLNMAHAAKAIINHAAAYTVGDFNHEANSRTNEMPKVTLVSEISFAEFDRATEENYPPGWLNDILHEEYLRQNLVKESN